LLSKSQFGAQQRSQATCCEHSNKTYYTIKGGKLFDHNTVNFYKREDNIKMNLKGIACQVENISE
jgi:hypothetical protein